MVVEDALGVPIGVEIDTANDGVLPVSAVVLGTRVVGGTTDGEAGIVALVDTLLHDAGTVLIVSLASWSDCFNESFFRF